MKFPNILACHYIAEVSLNVTLSHNQPTNQTFLEGCAVVQKSYCYTPGISVRIHMKNVCATVKILCKLKGPFK